MEKCDDRSSISRGGLVALSVVSVACIVVSVVALGLWLHSTDEISQLRSRQRTLERVVETLSNKVCSTLLISIPCVCLKNLKNLVLFFAMFDQRLLKR